MAEINFPPNPAPLDTFTDWNDVLWTFDPDNSGGAWSRDPGLVPAPDPNVKVDTAATNTFLCDSDVVLPTVGVSNTVVGSATGRAITTGERNTLVGTKAGSGIASTKENTIIGYEAGRDAATTSNGNVIVGAVAAANATAITGSTVIGTYANVSGTTDVNSIVIGHSAIGRGPNTAVIGNDAISKTYLKGEVILNKAIQTMSYLLANLPVPTVAGQIIWVSDVDPLGSGTAGNGVHCSSVLLPAPQWNVIGTNTKVNI